MKFRRLRTRLAVLYMGLFGFALLLVAIAVLTAVSGSARKVVQDELTASGAVYGQIWTARSNQLGQSASVLAQDYGFREAVATADEATIRSALDNLRARQGVDGALLLGAGGDLTAVGAALGDAEADALWAGLEKGVHAGVINLEGQPFQAVAAPIMAPVLIGWVVFVERLDETQMRNLEQLSAIPLSASVVTRTESGWGDASGRAPAPDAMIESWLTVSRATPVTIRSEGGEAMVLTKPLPAFDGQSPAVLVLTYPLKAAMKPYQGLFIVLGLIALAGFAIIALGSFMLARGVTRPIAALDEGVQRLRQGLDARVAVVSEDEIGRLAESFNTMAGDIRDREARLMHMALHDQETGLPNRLWLEQRAADHSGFVVLVGVNRFEIVRNAIGYDAMAEMMTALGSRLTGLADHAPVARVGAGALGLLIDTEDQNAAVSRAQSLCIAAETPLRVSDATVDVNLSAGVSPCTEPHSHLGSAVDRAAIALDQARAARVRVAAFDAVAYGDPGGNLSLVSDLLAGLKTGEVWLAYQPKYDLRSGAITAVEALMRWRHPDRGVVSPDLFIGMAEETGQIRSVTEWCLNRAIADQRTLAEAKRPMPISINISGRLLSDENFADFALGAISRAGADLCFEITETAVIDNPDMALRIVERFAAAGVAVSIDDYGSGLSSLAYLKQIRADELKIDKSFILTLDTSAKDALLVKSTIDLAH
ncbi:MAG TPA: EAL domain-containing protein, partial [Brevundimonas sp.]|nr:EAL domain-containing protein [Brevundimonas sp.]